MIVTIANPKGGTGKTTLVRALSGTATHAGNDVFLIDAVSRGEVSDQLVSVPVPVLIFDGSVIAAVNIAAPLSAPRATTSNDTSPC